MACAGNFDDEDFNDTITQTSDEIREMFCEDCEKELGVFVKADGFCVDCVEYKCSTCVRYHKKMLPQHNLLDSSNMPQDFCFDKCQKHAKEIIKFYCKSCETTACPKCKTEKHNCYDCFDICHIPSVIKSNKMTDEMKQLSLSIDDTQEELAAKRDRVVSNLTLVNASKNHACTSIQKHKATLKRQVQDQYKDILDDLSIRQTCEMKAYEQKRDEVIAWLDKEKTDLIERHHNIKRQMRQQLQTKQDNVFEAIDKTAQDLENQYDYMNQIDVHKLHLLLNRTDRTETEVNEMKTSFDRKKKTGEKCELFIAMKNVKTDLEKVKTDMQRSNDDTEIQNYEFLAEKDEINLISTECEVKFGQLLDKSEVKRTLTYERVIKLSPSKNAEYQSVTGLCKVSDQLVVADVKNASIKLLDLKLDTQISSIQLESKPFDVTSMNTEELATTLPVARKIQFLCLTQTGRLSLAQKISMGKKCYGIEYIKPNLVVACQDPGCVLIVSTRGDPIKTFTGFHKPRYINVNLNSGIFYVEDTEIQTDKQSADQIVKIVKKASSDGKIIMVSKPLPDREHGLAIDHFGSVYIGTNRRPRKGIFSSMMLFSRNDWIQYPIIKLSANLENVQAVDKKEIYARTVLCLFYCNKEDKLYVGTTQGEILVYKVA